MNNVNSLECTTTRGTEAKRRRSRNRLGSRRETRGDLQPADTTATGDTVDESAEKPDAEAPLRSILEPPTSDVGDVDREQPTETVLVLGSGYAGTGAIKRLEARLDENAVLTWVSNVEHHLLLHETHRLIRNPNAREWITVPIEEIKQPETRFVHGEVTNIDTAERAVELDDGSTIGYDYLVVALGSRTAFFGVDGLEEHALTLDSLDDALAIHDALEAAMDGASEDDPARVIVGGAGLAGVQCAGEIAAFRDGHGASLEITLVEGHAHVHPNNDPELQGRIRKQLHERDIELETGRFVRGVDETMVHFEDEGELEYDILLWTGGITARHTVEMLPGDIEHRHRVPVSSTFETGDDRVFTIGDSAFIPGEGDPMPPTAQAARQAAAVAAENVVRTMRDRPLETWSYEDRGTLVSVGDATIAHDVTGIPLTTFGGPAARFLKRTVTAVWLARVASLTRAIRIW